MPNLIFNDTTQPPTSHSGVTVDGFPFTDTILLDSSDGLAYLATRVISRSGVTETQTYLPDGRRTGHTFIVNETGLPETAMARALRETTEYEAYRLRQDEETKKRNEELDRKLREGNHWIISQGNDGQLKFMRDLYSNKTQEEAKLEFIGFQKEDRRHRLRDINAYMSGLKEIERQIKAAEALEIWPDQHAATPPQ